MSLKSIRTFGWLTGTSPNISRISKYGWLTELVETFPISSLFVFPIEFLSSVINNSKIPIEFGGVVTAFSVDKFIPLEFISQIRQNNELLVENLSILNPTVVVSHSYLSSLVNLLKNSIEYLSTNSLTNNIPIENQLSLDLDNIFNIEQLKIVDNIYSIPVELGGITSLSFFKFLPIEVVTDFLTSDKLLTEYLSETSLNNDLSIEFTKKQSNFYSLLIDQLSLLNNKFNVYIEYQGFILPFSVDKFMPINLLSDLLSSVKLPIEHDGSVIVKNWQWPLESRDVRWILVKRH